MQPRKIVYVASAGEFDAYKDRLKLRRCPACRATGFLIRHGYLRGYGGDGAADALRGWRVFCSNRGRKGGCGRTYGILLAHCLYRRVAGAGELWSLLAGLLDGLSIRKAWKAAPAFCREAGYKLFGAFKRSQTRIRALLHRLSRPAPDMGSSGPTLQLISHLKRCFPASSCPPASFQSAFQESFLAI